MKIMKNALYEKLNFADKQSITNFAPHLKSKFKAFYQANTQTKGR